MNNEQDRIFKELLTNAYTTRFDSSDKHGDREHHSDMLADATRQNTCACGGCKSGVKPLLVIQYRGKLSPERYELALQEAGRIEASTGYSCAVLDCMDESKVQVFGLDTPGMYPLTYDQLIDILEELKRMKEAGGGV